MLDANWNQISTPLIGQNGKFRNGFIIRKMKHGGPTLWTELQPTKILSSHGLNFNFKQTLFLGGVMLLVSGGHKKTNGLHFLYT